MTTLAWDMKSLAADRAVHCGNTWYTLTKIFHIELSPLLPYGIGGGGTDALIGVAGEACALAPVRHWLCLGGDWPSAVLPPSKDGGDLWGTIVIRRDRIVLIDTRGAPVEIDQQRYAFGAGDEFVRGCFAAGFSAAKAIEMAAKVSSSFSAGGIDVLTFDSPLWRPT
jgi:hypothetical protein